MARVLDLLIVASTAILSIRLLTLGFFHRYRAFFVYVAFAALRGGILHSISPTSGLYQKVWVVTEPIEWLFYVLVVLEVYSLVLQDYRGLSTVGRWALIVAVVVALLASGMSLLAPSQSSPQGNLMSFYWLADRAVYFSLVVFLLTILGLLMQYPITLSRNIIVHSLVFSVYFLSNTVIYLLLSARGYDSIQALSTAFNLVTLAAVGTWLAMLNPAGELRKLRLRPTWMPGREEELVSQLNHLNAALLRATRK